MNQKQCPHCDATWIDDQHYWCGTGKLGDEKKLAHLICDNPTLGHDTCINPAKGDTLGDGWEQRSKNLSELLSEW
jgi:hypothetical protein